MVSEQSTRRGESRAGFPDSLSPLGRLSFRLQRKDELIGLEDFSIGESPELLGQRPLAALGGSLQKGTFRGFFEESTPCSAVQGL